MDMLEHGTPPKAEGWIVPDREYRDESIHVVLEEQKNYKAETSKGSVTVKNNFGDAYFCGFLGDKGAYFCCDFDFSAFSDAFRRSGGESVACFVVNQLDIDALVAAEH